MQSIGDNSLVNGAVTVWVGTDTANGLIELLELAIEIVALFDTNVPIAAYALPVGIRTVIQAARYAVASTER